MMAGAIQQAGGGQLKNKDSRANVAAIHDCFGMNITFAELEKISKTLYWGGGVYGDPSGPLTDFSRAYAKLFKMGVKNPETKAGDYCNRFEEDNRNAQTFAEYVKQHRARFPDDYSNMETPEIRWIIKRCAQMRHQAETKGANAGYELWRAVLSICKFSTGDDPAIIDALTGGHADFNTSTTEQKMLDLSAPFRCRTFANYEPTICTTCRFNGSITSPISLGFEREPKLKRGEK